MPFQYKTKGSTKLPSSKVTVGPGQVFFKHEVLKVETPDGPKDQIVLTEVEVLGDWYKLTSEDTALLAAIL